MSQLAQANSGTGAAPWWLTVVVAVIAVGGVLTSAWLARRSANDTTNNTILTRLDTRTTAVELDKWRRREETMRMIRWASEKATQTNQKLASVGVAALDALGGSDLLQAEDQVFIDKVLEVILTDPVAEYHKQPEVPTVEEQEGA